MINCSRKQRQLYDDNIPLLEATILLRKHGDPVWECVMDSWWDEYIKYPTRDQISLPFVIWKNNLTLDDIYILGNNEYLNPRFVVNGHKSIGD